MIYMSSDLDKRQRKTLLKERYKKMIRYLNLGGNSNVYAYQYGEDYIDVQFFGGKVYRYSYRSAGHEKVEEMKKCATAGRGLNSYIMKYAKYDYER